MSLSRAPRYPFPYEGPTQSNETIELRAAIRDVLQEYVSAVQTCDDPEELARILRALELHAPSLRREGDQDTTERTRINRRRVADTYLHSGEKTSRNSFQNMSDGELIKARRGYEEWLSGGADHYYMLSPHSRPTRRDLDAVEAEMHRRGLLD